jgi:hypothetical protein
MIGVGPDTLVGIGGGGAVGSIVGVCIGEICVGNGDTHCPLCGSNTSPSGSQPTSPVSMAIAASISAAWRIFSRVLIAGLLRTVRQSMVSLSSSVYNTPIKRLSNGLIFRSFFEAAFRIMRQTAIIDRDFRHSTGHGQTSSQHNARDHPGRRLTPSVRPCRSLLAGRSRI